MSKRTRLPLVAELVTDTVPFQIEATRVAKERRMTFNKNIVPIAKQLMDKYIIDWDRAKRDAIAEFEVFGHQLFLDRGGKLC